MSDPPPGRESPTPVRPRRNPWLAAVMLIFGLILLLPGLCSIAFIGFAFSAHTSANAYAPLLPLWFFCFVVSALGIFLIVRVFR